MKQRMKTFVFVFVLIQSFACVGFLIFSIVQKIEADNQRALAEERAAIAIKEGKLARYQRIFFEERVKKLEDSLKILKAGKSNP